MSPTRKLVTKTVHRIQNGNRKLCAERFPPYSSYTCGKFWRVRLELSPTRVNHVEIVIAVTKLVPRRDRGRGFSWCRREIANMQVYFCGYDG
jgi:hypothetical protein